MIAYPEYSEEHLTTEYREQLHAAAASWKTAHDALLRNDLAGALNAIDNTVEIAAKTRLLILDRAALKRT